MKSVKNLVLSLPIFIVLSTGCSGLNKDVPEATIRIHPQAEASDSARFASPVPIPYPPYQIFVSKIPAISELDVKAFRSVQTDDGSYGALLFLKPRGKMALEQVSIIHPREYLVVMVNGRSLNPVLIDKPVRDGQFFIKNGLTDDDLARFAETFERVGAPVENLGDPAAEGMTGDDDDSMTIAEQEGLSASTGNSPIFRTVGGDTVGNEAAAAAIDDAAFDPDLDPFADDDEIDLGGDADTDSGTPILAPVAGVGRGASAASPATPGGYSSPFE